MVSTTRVSVLYVVNGSLFSRLCLNPKSLPENLRSQPGSPLRRAAGEYRFERRRLFGSNRAEKTSGHRERNTKLIAFLQHYVTHARDISKKCVRAHMPARVRHLHARDARHARAYRSKRPDLVLSPHEMSVHSRT